MTSSDLTVDGRVRDAVRALVADAPPPPDVAAITARFDDRGAPARSLLRPARTRIAAVGVLVGVAAAVLVVRDRDQPALADPAPLSASVPRYLPTMAMPDMTPLFGFEDLASPPADETPPGMGRALVGAASFGYQHVRNPGAWLAFTVSQPFPGDPPPSPASSGGGVMRKIGDLQVLEQTAGQGGIPVTDTGHRRFTWDTPDARIGIDSYWRDQPDGFAAAGIDLVALILSVRPVGAAEWDRAFDAAEAHLGQLPVMATSVHAGVTIESRGSGRTEAFCFLLPARPVCRAAVIDTTGYVLGTWRREDGSWWIVSQQKGTGAPVVTEAARNQRWVLLGGHLVIHQPAR